MKLSKLHSYLVYPGKKDDAPAPIGTELELAPSSMVQMLGDIFEKSIHECDIGVQFRHNEKGKAQNPCRDEILKYVGKPSQSLGQPLAVRLSKATTRVPGLALLFLMFGQDKDLRRLVLARFPADHGILAEEGSGRLKVEYVERIFLKSGRTYKSALYSGRSLDKDFWDGRAADKQAKTGPRDLAHYWIEDFLFSNLRVTPAAGSKRLASAYLEASRMAADLSVKTEIVSAATLTKQRDGEVISPRTLADQFGLSESAREQLAKSFKRADIMDESFQLDRVEFEKHIKFKTKVLDNGAMLTAEEELFEETFTQTELESQRVRFTTEGKVIDERLRRLQP